MKKLSLLLLLFSFAGIAPAQRTLFSTPLENGTIAAYIKTLPNRQYAVYAWQPEYMGSFIDPHMLWLDSKGSITRNVSSPDSFNRVVTSVGVHGLGCILETHKGLSDYSCVEKRLIYFDANGEIKWQRNFSSIYISYFYGQSYVEEPGKQLKVIYIDTSGSVTMELLDSNGSTLIIKTTQKNFDHGLIYNFIRVTDNRYLFAVNTSYDPAPFYNINRSQLFCIDSSGTVIWEKPFHNDTLNMGIIDHVLLLDNQIYVKTWKQEPNTVIDYTLYKLNMEGALLKQQIATTNATSYVYQSKLIPSKDHGFYFFWNEATGTSIMPSFIVKYDQELNLKWSRTFPEFTFSMDSTSCNGIVRTFRNDDSFSGSTVRAFVDPEMVDECDRCETIVYPNPSGKDFFNLRSSYYEVAIQHTELYDMAGRLVWKFDMPESNNEFTLKHDLADGMYLCRVTCDNGKTQLKRIVVNR